jgi:O-acetyl-ADP-ribose deacetylase (regulator of RNase III)
MPARWVFHAVGPIWHGGSAGEPELLASCHRRAIELADEHHCRSVAFPAISTGAYGYPVELAAPVAIAATQEALAAHPSVELARFVFRDEAALAHYRSALSVT